MKSKGNGEIVFDAKILSEKLKILNAYNLMKIFKKPEEKDYMETLFSSLLGECFGERYKCIRIRMDTHEGIIKWSREQMK